MKVGLPYSFFNHNTVTAIRFLVQTGDLPMEALTRAWFFEAILLLLKLMTSRTTKLALSKLDEQKYSEAFVFLNNLVYLFERVWIGSANKIAWKHVQSGVVLATTVPLKLQDYYLNKKNFFCVLLSRFGPDALEKPFSTLC